jgi:phospholipid/cholesterol/gamma-HCH transport system permease protein
MRVTDQIDALTTLSTNPMKYLGRAADLAGTLALPLLVVVADTLGVMGGWLIGRGSSASPPAPTSRRPSTSCSLGRGSGLIKAAVFGFVVTLMGCWCGYTSGGGAQGVGRATTSAWSAAPS